jgi:tetratricopeptide (TPR) repeat protein
MGDINFKRNDFTKAVEYYKTFLATTKDIDYTGIANYRIAVSLSMLGDSLESRNRLLLARMGNLDIPDDIYASEKSLRFFETGFSDDFKKVVIAKNNVEAGENEDAFNQLIEIADSIESAEIKGMAYFYLSEAAYGLNKFETSVLYSKKAGEIRYEKEKWVLPYAAYVTAKSNFKMGNYALSRAFLEIAESNNDFQYRDSIEALVNNLTRKLDIL